MLTQEELEALDNWRFSRRMPSRAAAVRELLKRGLATEGMELPSGRSRSQDYGVIDSPLERETESDGDGCGGDGRASGGDGFDGHGA